MLTNNLKKLLNETSITDDKFLSILIQIQLEKMDEDIENDNLTDESIHNLFEFYTYAKEHPKIESVLPESMQL